MKKEKKQRKHFTLVERHIDKIAKLAQEKFEANQSMALGHMIEKYKNGEK